MPNIQKDQVFSLIKSLSKSEKRNFKLYSNRIQSESGLKFVQLFEAMDKIPHYDEKLLLQKLPNVKKSQLANLKRHLYGQILTSLRLIYIDKNIDIQIREQLDFARILYGKGLYMQSLKLLDRIKKIAEDHHQDILHLEILEFEKMIEARHITRSRMIANKMETLLESSIRRSTVTYRNNFLSNLNIQVQGWYIQFGHARTSDEKKEFEVFYQSLLTDSVDLEEMTFFEKVNYFQAKFWYYYILLDFRAAQTYTNYWYDIFQKNPQMQRKDPMLYSRGLYYLLILHFILKEKEAFLKILQVFEEFVQNEKSTWNMNTRMTGFVYLSLSQLNWCLLEEKYTIVSQLIPSIIKDMKVYLPFMDSHRVHLIYYKIAGLYFLQKNYNNALEYINKVVIVPIDYLRNDLEINARLLHILCNYELNNFDLIQDYLLPALEKSILKAKDSGNVQKAMVYLVKKLIKQNTFLQKKIIEDFYLNFHTLSKDEYAVKEIAYFDVPKWLQLHLHTPITK
jgi:hypothetical protein